MQEIKERRSNADRSSSTRKRVLEAAKTLFITKGYAATGTPEIVAQAGVTRGALYHHFEDKRALYLALVEAESAAVAAEIDCNGSRKSWEMNATSSSRDPMALRASA